MNSMDIDRSEAEYEVAWDFNHQFCNQCVNQEDDWDFCEYCFGDGCHFEEREDIE